MKKLAKAWEIYRYVFFTKLDKSYSFEESVETAWYEYKNNEVVDSSTIKKKYQL